MYEQVVFAAAHGLSRTCFVAASIVAADKACPGGHLAAVAVPAIIGHGADWVGTPLNDWNTPFALPFLPHSLPSNNH